MKKTVAVLLAVLLLVMCLPFGVLAAEKKDVTREIAVVFDNSGSMYMWRDDWCRATYAVEVFAAMMNEGDTLKVFPMNPVTTSKGEYPQGSAITVKSPADIAEVHEMYTPRAGGTPIESIYYAFDSLKTSTADEKWLVVITDGGTFHKGNMEMDGSATARELTKLLGEYVEYADDVFVQYLGIGAGTAQPDLPQSTHYRSAVATDSSQIVGTLTQACNEIFGRDTLPDSCRSGQQVNFDVTMKKMIVFAQGAGAAVNSLSGPSGAVAEVPNTRYTVTYSDKGCGNYDTYEIDDTLGGVVVTYGAASAGTYTLDYTGTDVAIYYEPDVSLKATVVDADGNVLDGNDPNLNLTAGQYTITYELIDNGTGAATTSNLLGTVEYNATATIGGSQMPLQSGVPVTLEEGQTLEFDIRAAYLSGYEARFTSSDYFLHGQNLRPAAPEAAGALAMQLTGGAAEYTVSSLAANAVYTVIFTYEGVPLTVEEMQDLQLTLDVPAGIEGTVAKDEAASRATVSLAPAGGQALAPGDMTFTVSGVLPHDNTDDATGSVSGTFAIKQDALALELSAEKTYLVIGKLESYEPFALDVTYNGSTVDDAALQQLVDNMTVEIKGSNVQYTATPVPGASRIHIALKHAGDPSATKTGGCDMTVSTGMQDPSGNVVSQSAEISFTLSVLPLWLKILIALLIIAVITALIMLYMSMKVLPKTMTFTDAEFWVRGVMDDTMIPTIRSAKGFGQKSVSISITSPDVNGQITPIGLTLTLERYSPRKIKSSRRQCLVKAMHFSNASEITSAMIGADMFDKDRETDTLVLDGYEPGETVTYNRIGNRAECTIDAMCDTGTEVLPISLSFAILYT